MKLTKDLIIACGFDYFEGMFDVFTFKKSCQTGPSAHRIGFQIIRELPSGKFYYSTHYMNYNSKRVEIKTLGQLLKIMRELSFDEGRLALADSVFDALDKQGFNQG
jgi:hypothetical protein